MDEDPFERIKTDTDSIWPMLAVGLLVIVVCFAVAAAL